jgi:hypothetical protein
MFKELRHYFVRGIFALLVLLPIILLLSVLFILWPQVMLLVVLTASVIILIIALGVITDILGE